MIVRMRILALVGLAASCCGRSGFDPNGDAHTSDAPADAACFVGELDCKRIVFVTSVIAANGNLGGVTGADGICQGAAAASS